MLTVLTGILSPFINSTEQEAAVFLDLSKVRGTFLCVTFCRGVSAGVKSVSIDVGKEEVLVESALTSSEVQALIESTGCRAVLKGIGGLEQGESQQDNRRYDDRIYIPVFCASATPTRIKDHNPALHFILMAT